MAKTLFIKTWGCQMNVYDSARMADVLAPAGYRPVEQAELADVVIFNTCHIREKAADKVFSELGRLRTLQQAKAAVGGRMVVAVAGCVAQAEGEELAARAPWVDIILGPQTYHRLPELLRRVAAEPGRTVIDTEFATDSKFDALPEESESQGSAAFLSIQEGCDKFCSFCVVPFTRGAEYSRPAAAILAEARRLIAKGSIEITLLGQTVNAYHGAAPDGQGEWRLGRLLRALAELPGLQRLRYTTSHPCNMDDDLIAAHGELPRLMPLLHLPLQSGSDRILKAMNRRHSGADYLRLAQRLRAANPDLALSTDLIVGFPGESDDDFAQTLRLVREVGFAQAYSFKYSPRPGTAAAERTDEMVPEALADARLAELQQLLSAQQLTFNQSFVGRTVSVLFDRPGRRLGQLLGRSPWLHAVHAVAPERLLGQLVEVRIDAGFANSLAGSVVGADGDQAAALLGDAA